MAVARRGQAAIAGPAVGGHGRGPGDVPTKEALEALGRDVGHHRQPEPAQAAAAGLASTALDRTGDHGLAAAAAGLAGLGAADIGLVGLDLGGERRAPGADHRAADLVQPGPGSLVAAEAHLALQLQGRDPALARAHQVDRKEPLSEPGFGLLEDRALEQRVLLATGRALVDVALLEPPGLAVTARSAAKPVRPALLQQIGVAPLVGAEARNERRQVLRQILGQHHETSTVRSPATFYRSASPDQPKPDGRGELATKIRSSCDNRLSWIENLR